MSTTTPNLGLFKYDPSTDGAQTFNIRQALNENWDKVDESVLLALAAAAPYSTSKTYAVGAYCTRDGKLYRCTTAITTSETWTAGHWTETTVGAELIAIYTALQNKAPAGYGLGTNAKDISGVDFNTVRDNGWYMFATAGENRPYDNMGYSYMLVAKRSNENLTQIVFIGNAADYAGCIVKRVNLSGTWYPWEWVNPPMYLDVEYRTTERYKGKPVYAKLIDLGLSAAGGTVSANANISNWESFVFVQAIVGGTAAPIFPNTSFTGAWCVYVSNINSTTISVYTGSSRGGEQCYCLLKYTKTTD